MKIEKLRIESVIDKQNFRRILRSSEKDFDLFVSNSDDGRIGSGDGSEKVSFF
jgi:hypothetical protein